MPNPILLKFNATAGVVPTAGALTVRELALNTADGRLFTKTAGGAVVEFSRKDSPAFSGKVTVAANGVFLPASTAIAAASGATGGVEVQGQGSSATAGAAFMTFHRPGAYAAHIGLDTDNFWKVGGWSMGAVAYKLWHEGSDGAGSGLDADLLDGQQGSYYAPINAPVFTGSPRVPALFIGPDSDVYLYESAANALSVRTGAAGAEKYFTFNANGNFSITGGTLTVSSTTAVTNLNADLLDGSHRDTTHNSFGAGTIPVRHSSGYLYSNYFNCTADTTATAPSHVAVQTSTDNFIRWQTWAQFKANLGALPAAAITSVISANTAAVAGTTYVLTASLTLTLPATPAAGNMVTVSNRSGTATCVVARNAQNIMGLAEDMTLDGSDSVRLLFADATRGWVLI